MIFRLLLIALALASPIAASAGEPFVIGQTIEIESKVLGETRSLIISEPASYGVGEDRYPVLIVLDGDTHFHHTTGLIDYLALSGHLPEMIVVAVPNTDRNRDLTPATSSKEDLVNLDKHGGADTFLRFLGEELLPYIDNSYRTRDQRILVGHSYGGLFVVNALITQPQLFQGYIAISPSLQWDQQGVVKRAEAFFDATPELNAALYVTAGNEGGTMLGGVRKLAGVLEEKAPRNFRWDFAVMPNESHASVPLRSTYAGLEHIFAGWTLPDLVGAYDDRGLEGIRQHYEKARGRFGYDTTIPHGDVLQLSWQLIEAGRLEDAATVIYHDVEQYPLTSILLDLLAAAHAERDEKDLAIKYYSQSLEVNPGSELVKEKLAALGVDASKLVKTYEIDPETLPRYVGKYAIGFQSISFGLEDDALYVDITGLPRTTLVPTEKDVFIMTTMDVRFVFDVEGEAPAKSVVVHQFGQVLPPAMRVEEAAEE